MIEEMYEKISEGVNFVSRQRKPFKINMLRVAIRNFFRMDIQPYQSLYILALGATTFQVGIVNSIGAVAGAFIALPSGLLADKYGVRKIFLVSTLLMVTGGLLFASTPNWIMIIPAIFFAVLGLQMDSTACPIVCGTCLENKERATGKMLCDTFAAIPTLISPIVYALLISHFGGLNVKGIRPLYFLQFIGFCALFILIITHFPELHREKSLKDGSSFVDSLRQVFAEGINMKRWILLYSLSAIPIYMGKMTYLPMFAAEIKNADQFILGGMATASGVVPLLLSIPVGKLADTIGRKKVYYMTTLVYCLSLMLLVYASNPVMLLASGFLQGFLFLSGVIRGTMTPELISNALLGRLYGILVLFKGLTSVVAPILGGAIWNTIGPQNVFFFIVLIQIFSLIILFTMPETLEK